MLTQSILAATALATALGGTALFYSDTILPKFKGLAELTGNVHLVQMAEACDVQFRATHGRAATSAAELVADDCFSAAKLADYSAKTGTDLLAGLAKGENGLWTLNGQSVGALAGTLRQDLEAAEPLIAQVVADAQALAGDSGWTSTENGVTTWHFAMSADECAAAATTLQNGWCAQTDNGVVFSVQLD